MAKTLLLDRDFQLKHMTEIGSAQASQSSGVVAKNTSLVGPPLLTRLSLAAVTCAAFHLQNAIDKSRCRYSKTVLAFQPGVHIQQILHLFPSSLKGILARPRPRSLCKLAGHSPQLSILECRLGIRAPFKLAASVSKLSSTFTKANNLLTCLSMANFDVPKDSLQRFVVVADREF